jgi:hypothetical protein
MDEYIKREDAIKHLRGACIAKYPLSFSYGIFASADEISKLPPADVVPKSEVDWSSIPVDVSEALKQRAVEKAKTEVASEIFEEIEKTIRAALILVGFSYKHQAKEMECRKECYEDFLGYIAKLKKKYIPKDCRVCKHMLSCEPNVFSICDEYEEEIKNE